MTEPSNAVVKLADGVVFKRPLVPNRIVKKRKYKVLEEDTYLEEMGKIIQRDFFPDLEKIKAQNDYLDALNKNDLVKLRAIHSKYTAGSRIGTDRSVSASPATFETPLDSRPGEDDLMRNVDKIVEEANKKAERERTKLSLDQYLASNTSEDNQSFEDLIDEASLRHKKKHAWLYKEDSIEEEKKLAIASGERPAIEMWEYKDKNYIMYVPDGVDLTPDEKIELAKRKQEVNYNSTRFHSNPFDEAENQERIQDLAHLQAKSLDGKIGVDGKELVSNTPKVNGYGFVKTPSPAPGVGETPFMTWGEIEGTPFRLDGSDTPLRATPGPSFFLPEPPSREKLAIKLADKVSERNRDKKKKAIEAARRQLTSPLTRPGSMDRLNMLSPAAKKFASTHLMGRISSDKKLSSYYSPARSLSGTPKSQSGTPSHPNSAPPISITTDNLLNLNVKRRPRASDFFS